MDLEMPVMDGLSALKHIREEEAAGTLARNLVIALSKLLQISPVIRVWLIILAGNARQGQIDGARAAGMDEGTFLIITIIALRMYQLTYVVVIKPYRLDDLLQKIEEMMKIRNMSEGLAIPTSPVQPIREGSDAIEIEQ